MYRCWSFYRFCTSVYRICLPFYRIFSFLADKSLLNLNLCNAFHWEIDRPPSIKKNFEYEKLAFSESWSRRPIPLTSMLDDWETCVAYSSVLLWSICTAPQKRVSALHNFLTIATQSKKCFNQILVGLKKCTKIWGNFQISCSLCRSTIWTRKSNFWVITIYATFLRLWVRFPSDTFWVITTYLSFLRLWVRVPSKRNNSGTNFDFFFFFCFLENRSRGKNYTKPVNHQKKPVKSQKNPVKA